MNLKWFNAQEAAKIGVALADEFAAPQSTGFRQANQSVSAQPDDALHKILRRADLEVRNLGLNFYKRAKFANSFKWRLLDNGLEEAVADAVTQRLVLHLSVTQSISAPGTMERSAATRRHVSKDANHLLTLGNNATTAGAYVEAIPYFESLIELKPSHAVALNNLGAALYRLGRYKEADARFQEAIRVKPDYADPYSNMGTTLLLRGLHADAEHFLRRALKLNPRFVNARIHLGLALAFTSHTRDAKAQFEKALKQQPRSAEALYGMAFVAGAEGNFDQASALIDRALQIHPNMPKALASQAWIRKMTLSDIAWLERAEEVAASGIAAVDESALRFAIGKYYDDVEDFKRAFHNYNRANDLVKAIAEPYARDDYEHFVDAMIRVYAPGEVSRGTGASDSMKPVFVVGMPRSGTSLTEQIIASHPSARGAGELPFWSDVVQEHYVAIEAGQLGESTRSKLAETYVRLLETGAGDALRIVDKAPVNSDHLGLIHSIFPNARFIYMRRNPWDTCLSCYFQKFALSLNFTMDLADLAHYFRQHTRLIEHWRSVLPPGTILDVPYEELVADQAGWTRKILDFLGLEWDERVIDFHNTKRTVATASFWQVRQKIYQNSVQRWRNYEKFVGWDLKDLDR
jgi:tetratricopeptide (TPR) repeat protein